MGRSPCRALVRSVEHLTPLVRRLVLGGDEIAALAPPAGALGPYVKFRFQDEAGRISLRTYSIRRYDAASAEMQIDIVLHDGASLGSAFATNVEPGATIVLAGPGFIPAETCARYLLAGDHAALPAIGHILETLPARCDAIVAIEVPGRAEEQAFGGVARRRIAWLHRPVGAPSRLAEAVEDLCPSETDGLLVWAGAEAAIARTIRRHTRARRDIPPERSQILNYWKRGRAEGEFSYMA